MPTFKQKAAVAKLMENPSRPLGEVMTEVGYEPHTAKNPENLTESKGFIQLLEEHGLDDASLAKRHKELLATDDNIAIKALDMAYKVKSHYAPERSMNLNVELQVNDEAVSKLANLLSNKDFEIHEGTSKRGDGAGPDQVDSEIQHQD